jgi:hypothetical protein
MWTTKEILPTVDPENNSYYNYFKLISMWSQVFGASALNIRLYEQVCNDTTLIDDFLSLLPEIDRKGISIPSKSNKSLSKECRDILIWLNAEYPKPDAYRVAFKRFVIAEYRKESYSQQRALPSKHQAIQFYQLFEESNKLLAKTYLDADCSFDESFEQYPDVAVPYLDEMVIRNRVHELELMFPNRFLFLLTRFDSNTLVYLLNLMR